MFNGDVDTLCSHMMNMKFVTNLNRQILGPERVNLPWTYKGETPNVAGFMTQYTLSQDFGCFREKCSSDLDYLTVRGAGHLSPGDKPREVLQMLYNWINGNDYSKPDPFSWFGIETKSTFLFRGESERGGGVSPEWSRVYVREENGTEGSLSSSGFWISSGCGVSLSANWQLIVQSEMLMICFPVKRATYSLFFTAH